MQIMKHDEPEIDSIAVERRWSQSLFWDRLSSRHGGRTLSRVTAAVLLLLALTSVRAASRAFPEVRLTLPDGEAFSPNADGIRDGLRVALEVKEGKDVDIVDWELQIVGSQGLVRSFFPDRRATRVSGLFGKASSVAALPESLVWDGRDERGRIVTDGRYRLEFVATHSYNRIERRTGREVRVDTVLPTVTLKVVRSYVVRLPGLEGRPMMPSGEILIEQAMKELAVREQASRDQTPIPEPGIQFTGRILDAAGEVVESRHWTNSLPAKIAWNGLRTGGEPAPPGVYRYELEWGDPAGNRRRAHVFQLQVVTSIPEGSLSSESFFVDRNGRSIRPLSSVSIQHTAKMRPSFLRLEKLEARALRASVWRDVSRFRTSPVANLAAQHDLFGTMPDGGLVRLTGVDEANSDVTSSVYFFVDSSPPIISMQMEADRWSPAEWPYRAMRMRPRARSAAPLADWAIACYVDTGRSRTVLREWKGDGVLPDEIVWMGDADAYHLSGGEKLYFEFQASTMAGRSSRVTMGPVVVGAHFLPVRPRSEDLTGIFAMSGLISDGRISPDGERLLDETAALVKGLEGYRLRVRAHVSFQGEEDENLLRSERLARQLRDALIARGLPAGETTFRGEGETDLLSEGDDDFSLHRNNRVLMELQRIRRSGDRP